MAVRAKMAGLDDEENASLSCADTTTTTTTTSTTTEAPASQAEAKAGVPEAGSRGEARGPEAVPPRQEHDGDNDVCAPLRRKRCHEGSAPQTADVGPSRTNSPPLEIPRKLLSSTPLSPPSTESPKTPVFSCAFSTPDGAGTARGMPARENEGASICAKDSPEEGGRSEGVAVGGGGGSGSGTTRNVVVTSISRDALAAAAAGMGAALTGAVSSSDGRGDEIACSSSSAEGCRSVAGNESHLRTEGTVAAAAAALEMAGTVTEAALAEGGDVEGAKGAKLWGARIAEKEDRAEDLAPTEPPSRRSSSSSSSSSGCSCSGCSASCSSCSLSMARAAESFLEGAAKVSAEQLAKQCAADRSVKDFARDEDEEEDGYRTQSTSSVSDHTDAESDSDDTDAGECEDRPKREDSGVRKNGERPPRTPFRRELPVRNYC